MKDSGAGISVENQQELFKEGRQFNANQLQGGSGSGLGLFITRGVVKLHGGDIVVYSKGEGHGCTCTIILPAILVESTTDTSSDLTDLEEGGVDKIIQRVVSSKSKEIGRVHEKGDGNLKHVVTYAGIPSEVAEELFISRVMVVDDSRPSRKMLCRLLNNSGYQCTQAENGQECVDMMVRDREAESNSSDQCAQIIFMDFEMPIKNGPDAVKALRELGFSLPIIGVTGNVLPADKAYFMEMGANEVLSKPLHIEDLNSLVRRYTTTLPKPK